jgi:hypothetical protein
MQYQQPSCTVSKKLLHFFIAALLLAVLTITLLAYTHNAHAASTSNLSLKLRHSSTIQTTSCGAWNVISSPNVPGSGENNLLGVTAVSDKNIWAVGYYIGTPKTLIEHWNGTSWNVVPSPSPGSGYNMLRGVTAISASNIWAVGYYVNIGTSNFQTIIEHWNGRKWTLIRSPNPGSGGNYLFGISAISERNIWTIGYYNPTSTSSNSQTLIEHWNGTSWNVVSSPYIASAYNILNAVTAISPSNIWAVGDANHQTLIEHWDGTGWSIVPSPNLSAYNDLYGVTGVSASNIWAVGTADANTTDLTMVEHWDGTNWSIISSPNPATSATPLNAVVAFSSTNIWAVGSAQSGSNGASQTLIEHWDGTGWSIVPSPNAGSSSNRLNGLTRVPGTSSHLWTVGSYYNGTNNQTLTESYC